MKWMLLLTLALSMGNPPLHSQTSTAPTAKPTQPLVHVSSTFSITVNAPMRDAAPLFGPEGERAWAGKDWDPQFVFPSQAKDVEGAVFTVRHGEHTAVWVNTVFDLKVGRMQYVYVMADLLATTIDVRLHPIDPTHTGVDVTYVRTALRPEANEHVLHLGTHDADQGPEWQGAINESLQHQSRPRQ